MKKYLAAFAGLAMAASASQAAFVNINLNNVPSWNGFGSAQNFVASIATGIANGQVVSIGWDVVLDPTAPGSWYDDMAVDFANTANTTGVSLRPGAGNLAGGPPLGFSSGGLIDLVGLNLDFALDADGALRLEFYETFDDAPGAIDGFWISGTITVEVIPAPSALALAGMGGLLAARRRR